MRIISGKYRGTVLNGHNIVGTRPTMDRVKESLVAMVQTKLKNAVILDLFTGSGSVGLEMISNGAKCAYLVDKNPKVIEVLKKNLVKLNPDEEVNLIKKDFKDACRYFKDNNIKFDIVFLDPPYELNFINPSIQLIKEYNLLNEEGLIICESEFEVVENHGYEVYKERKYGSKKIIILKDNN
jgi:16S rRNA (guanine(966)-N(2))-methyltransferase RsmD